jgi:hypothetical protein
MAKFRVVTTAGPAPADYGYEMEALAAIDAEIVELPNDEAGFIARLTRSSPRASASPMR